VLPGRTAAPAAAARALLEPATTALLGALTELEDPR
jgi:GntR family transcriptional regulator, transcriptional repressor for pyruvate dehydrogenase complex